MIDCKIYVILLDIKMGLGECMSTFNIVQMSLEAWGAVFCIVTMVVTMYRAKTRSRKLLGNALFFNALVLALDALSDIGMGNFSPVGMIITRVGVSAVYVLQFILLVYVGEYIFQSLQERKLVKDRKIINRIHWACTIGIIIILINNLWHFIYNFDDENRYIRFGGWYFIMLLYIILTLYGMIGVLKHRHELSKRELYALESYIYFPLIMLIVQVFLPGESLINVGTTLSLICMYISDEIGEIEEKSRMAISLSEQEAENERQSALIEKQRAEAEKRKLEAERTTRSAFESKMNLLLGQIQPHFVYNSLATIRSLVIEDPEEAVETIDHFSSYLRGSLSITDGTTLVPFSVERKLVDDYLFMEKKRFGDKVNVVREIETEDFMIPPLSIQTLVENAVRHGIRAKNTAGTITIKTREDEKYIYIEIKDDGVGFDTLTKSDGKHHIGTASTRARIKELLRGKMVIQSALGAGTTIKIQFPKSQG